MRAQGPVDVAVFVFPYASPVVPELAASLRRTLAAAGLEAVVVGPRGAATDGCRLRVRMPRRGPLAALGWSGLYLPAQAEMAWRAWRLRGRARSALFFVGPHFAAPMLVARWSRWPTVYAPGGWAGHQQTGWRGHAARRLQRPLLRWADVVATESQAEADAAPPGLRAWPLALRCVEGPPRVAPPSQRPRSVLFLGRLEACKGLPQLLEALPRLDAERIDVAGAGSLDRAVVAAARRDGRVRFHGWVDDQEKSRLLREARLVVMPSLGEGVPTVLLEAMAHGAPVLATAVGGIPDLVRDGVTGFLLPDATAGALLQGVERALGHPDLDDVAAAARALVAERCSPDAAAQRWRELVGLAHGRPA